MSSRHRVPLVCVAVDGQPFPSVRPVMRILYQHNDYIAISQLHLVRLVPMHYKALEVLVYEPGAQGMTHTKKLKKICRCSTRFWAMFSL